MAKGWQSVFDAIWRWDVGVSIEIAVVVAIIILIILVLSIYDKCCAGTVERELEPTEMEMSEFSPHVETEVIEYITLNQRELEPLANEDDTYSMASTIPIDQCVMITKNIVRRVSQVSVYGNEEDEEEGNAILDTDHTNRADIETNTALPSDMEQSTPNEELAQGIDQGSDTITDEVSTEVTTSDRVSISIEDD